MFSKRQNSIKSIVIVKYYLYLFGNVQIVQIIGIHRKENLNKINLKKKI